MALAGEAGQLCHQARLLTEIEGRGRFVHHQNAGALDEGAGDQNRLALPAGQRGVAPLGELQQVKPRQGLADGQVVRWPPPFPPGGRGAPHGDDLAHREGKGGHVGLGHIGDTVGDGPA